MPVLGQGAGTSPSGPNTATTGGTPAQTYSGLATSGTWQKQVSGYLYGASAGQLAGYGLQGAVADQQLALSPYTLAVQEQNLTSSTGYDFANDLLGYQGLGLQSQGLAAQAGAQGQQQGLEQAGFAVTQQKYGQEQQQAALEEQQRQLGLQSQAAGAGTLGTKGSKTAQTTAGQEYAWQSATIYRQQQLAQLGQQSEQIGYQTKAEQLALGQQQLSLTAQKQGLGVQQAQSQLGFGLQQLGIKSTPASYLSQIAQAEEGGATTARGVLSTAALIGGLGPSFGQGG
jgi:hypothetical protein